MIKKIKELLEDGRIKYDLTVKFSNEYGDFVSVYLSPKYSRDGIPMYSSHFLEEGYEDKIYDTILGFKDFLKSHTLTKPVHEDQKNNNGWFHQNIEGDLYVQWKRVDDVFYFNGSYEKDVAGFVKLNAPRDLSEYVNTKPLTDDVIRDRFHGDMMGLHDRIIDRIVLNDGEELWSWDDIRFLSGTAGFLIVKDGKVLKSQVILRS